MNYFDLAQQKMFHTRFYGKKWVTLHDRKCQITWIKIALLSAMKVLKEKTQSLKNNKQISEKKGIKGVNANPQKFEEQKE